MAGEHRWSTILGQSPDDTRFPLVCSRCLARDDSPEADQPCDDTLARLREVPDAD